MIFILAAIWSFDSGPYWLLWALLNVAHVWYVYYTYKHKSGIVAENP